MEEGLKVGNVVCIKSNTGVLMTVNERTTNGIECVWFDENNILLRDIFNEKSLVKIYE